MHDPAQRRRRRSSSRTRRPGEEAEVDVGGGAEVQQHDLEAPLEFAADASFDGVVCALVLHHLTDRARFLVEPRAVESLRAINPERYERLTERSSFVALRLRRP
ncbi:methyltransferase domain-containing protein [Micromonospora sp. CA-240977]|uniref:methyltransferase domain-containing protein n=1 Tax=Micromonospora sp. CA-240977 TaxID=3239957 RepID=UPI003D8C6314